MPQRLRLTGRRTGVSSSTSRSLGPGAEPGEPLEHSGAELLDAAPEPWARRWAGLTLRSRAVVVTAGLLVLAVAVAAGAAAVREALAERAAARAVDVRVELGVDVSSSASDSGGRVDHWVAVTNRAPRAVQITRLRLEDGRLRARVRGADGTSLASGATAVLPLSVDLDCRRPEPLRRGSTLLGRVGLVRADGRAVERPVVVGGAVPLVSVSRTLCRLDPQRVVGELSGPVGAPPPPAGTSASG